MDRRFAATLLLILAAGVSQGCASRGVRLLGRAIGAGFSGSDEPSQKQVDLVVPGAKLAATWVGHATVLVQMGDKFILTDPSLTATVGQVSRRLVNPGIEVGNLPMLDAVLISHLHLDHLSLGSLERIEHNVKRLFVPETGLVYVTSAFEFPSYEIRTWQTWERDGLKITSVPVQHVGWRYAGDRSWMTVGFTGYVVEYQGLKVYFGGDTGYHPEHFKETGRRFPGIDLALIPIAPIEPREFMKFTHVDPAEALQAFTDLGARQMVPIHFDTYINSTDRPGDAGRGLQAAMSKRGFSPEKVVQLPIGGRRVFR